MTSPSKKWLSGTSAASRSAGFSLVELMIAITIGLLVVAGVSSIFLATIRSSTDTLRATRLNQELRAVMDIMARDIRRAGSWGNATAALGGGVANPFLTQLPARFDADEPLNSCLTFTYDADQDGILDIAGGGAADERFGYRLRDEAVEIRQSGALCDAGGWENLTDESTIRITGLQFAVVSPALDVDGVAGGPNITVRGVTVTLSGQLRGDQDVNRQIVETIRTRNDTYRLVPLAP